MNMEYVKVTLPLPENEAGGSGEMELHFRLREPSEGMAASRPSSTGAPRSSIERRIIWL